ncbi:MAG: hypothetical protein RL625_1346 [Gemmatimonadota bacterium]
MAQIDRLLRVVMEKGGEALVLRDGEPAQLAINGQGLPLTKPLSGAQVLGLLREIAPKDAAESMNEGKPTKFPYAVSDVTFTVRVMRDEAGVRVECRPEGDADVAKIAAVAAAAPAVPPAPVTPDAPSESDAPVAAVARPTVPPVDPAERAVARDRIDALLRTLASSGSSDLHLRVGEPPVLRKSGELVRIEGQAVLADDDIVGMIGAIIPEENATAFAKTNDTDFAYEIRGIARFRANVFAERKGNAAVFRVIPATVLTVEQLGITPEVQKLCYLTKGLVLVTGPTGSGKSTTLASLIDLVNRVRSDHIITIEDPIEFVHPNKNCIVTQRQVGMHTGSFKSALRAALREDPDIILVGELRDLETVSIAIETAETGHLVFGTLHTSTAASTIDRIIDQFSADQQEQVRTMLAESLKGVVAQVLCRKIGGGRVAAHEILIVNTAISNLIREGKTFQIPSMMQAGKKIGMITMNESLLNLVEKKLVEPQEAWMKAVDKPSLVAQLRARGHDVSFAEGELSLGSEGEPLTGAPLTGAPR